MEGNNCFIFGNKIVPGIFFERGNELKFKRNQIIYYPGQLLEGILIVTEGRVENFIYSSNGNSKIFFIFGPGSIIGETNIFGNVLNPVYYKASDNAKALYVSRNTLVDILKTDYTAVEFLMESMAKKIVTFYYQTQDLTFGEAETRVCNTLIQLARYYGEKNSDNTVSLNIKITHQFLSDILGINRTTASKIAISLKKRNLIDVKSGKYIITDIDKLSAYNKAITE
ncbi:Crp/Fnr family transcriptional regulator [Dehalobacter restrictus]|uniref:Crp/Fnr family transcriptional regulator n=1 Tax=Dehalobacter restrictus (strain DSM 9455 / PER-K23) TaxID=871738 RepID=A0ABN4BVU3_DEHRP|nr:Crp/Fnr family transcriptional regulator [Dehalobacter restrictus]AHF11409.1 hypothetical protein DEHRE_10415 [Dehalobacter restrictus DSM 9455]